MSFFTVIILGLILIVVIAFIKTVRVVPQKVAIIIERLGKYNATLDAGLHILMPFIDKVAYRHTLKEQAIDVPSQICITRTISPSRLTHPLPPGY